MNKILVSPSGKLFWQGKEYKCALGKNGVSLNKMEGDGKTPSGSFPLRKVFYRKDRLNEPKTKLPTEEIKENYGWCDDPKDPNYNKLVKLPHYASHEKLWRDDNIYDVIVTIGYNDDPPIPGKGSAIFLHIARPEFTPTDGCIALNLNELLEILESITLNTEICIQEK